VGYFGLTLDSVPFFAHHGMRMLSLLHCRLADVLPVFVPIGYGAKELSDNSKVIGGSAW
jgi:hypothetical protein